MFFHAMICFSMQLYVFLDDHMFILEDYFFLDKHVFLYNCMLCWMIICFSMR